jgi:hypothetical protein
MPTSDPNLDHTLPSNVICLGLAIVVPLIYLSYLLYWVYQSVGPALK